MSDEATSPLPADARRDFAVIVPAFNEVENIPDLVTELRATFERHGLEGEVLLVDDGSTDGTGERARQEAEHWDRLRVLSHRRNFGKTESVVTAADATDARWLILFDADLQHSTEEIPRFLAELAKGTDIVTGRKVGHYEKHAVSRIYNALNRLIFKVPVSDLNSMKGFRAEVLDEIHLRHDWHRFFVVLAYDRGFTMSEIDVALLPRRHGVSKYSGRGRIVVGLLDLISVAFFVLFSRKPLMLFGVTGLAFAAAGILIGLIVIGLRIAHVILPFGYRPPLGLVVLLETLGFLLFGFGFVAELLAQERAEIAALERRVLRRDGARRTHRDN